MSKEKKKASNKSIGDGTPALQDRFSTPKVATMDKDTLYLIRLEAVRNEYQILRDRLTFRGVTDEIKAKTLAHIDQHEKEMLDYINQAAKRNSDNEPPSEGGGDNEPPSESGNDNEPPSKDKQSNIKRSKSTRQSYTVTP